MKKKFKASHFENIEELIRTCKMWIKDDDWDAYCRFFDMDAMEELIIELDKEKEKNKELSEKVIENICNKVEIEVFEEMRQELNKEKEKNKELEEYKKISELTKISCCTAQNCGALSNAIRNGLENQKLREKLDKKDKIINEMAAVIYDYANLGSLGICPAELENGILNMEFCKSDLLERSCCDCIKEYFTKKVGE